MCAAAIEVALHRRLEGVATVAISQSRQTVVAEFADGRRPFSPSVFRAAVDESGVEVLTFQIDACGVIEQKESQRWLIAGENRFLLEEGGTAPVEAPVCVSGRLNDRAEPYRLAITAIQPAQP
jgi:hypothetical protein